MSKTSNREIEQIIRLMRRDASYDAPEDAVRWSKNIFRARAAAAAPKKSFVERVAAVLQMDLSPNRAAFGERSASAGQARQLLFQAGDASLDLRIRQEEKSSNVQGQILGAGFADCVVRIFNENDSFETRANELSEFSFSEIPGGTYSLNLQSGEKEIVVEHLKLN
jgi:hypothetical protein